MVTMWVLKVLLCFYLQFVLDVQSTPGLYGFQRMCLCRCGVSQTNSRTGRNPGEQTSVPTAPHEYPWLAAINIGAKVVAGSLISDKHVLTAASPLYGLTPDRLIVTLGAHDRCIVGSSALNVTVESIYLHSGYFPGNQAYDLALIKLKHMVAFSEYISPVCLPIFGAREYEQVTWTAGWSQDNSSCGAHVAVLPTLTSTACLKEVEAKVLRNDKGCLGPYGVKSVICESDVGSPVMSRWSTSAAYRLIGVLSTSSCNVTTPPIYTKVIDYVSWIYEHTRRDCQCF